MDKRNISINKKEKINKYLILFGNTTTRMGSIAYSIAISLFLLTISKEASLLGQVKGYSAIPMIFLNLFSGCIADSFNKKKLLVFCDSISAIACFIFYFLGSEYHSNVVLIVITNMIISISSTVLSPAMRAIMPEAVGKEQVKTCNALLSNFSELSRIIIPLLVTFLFERQILGFSEMIIINGLTFAISALSEKLLIYEEKNKDNETRENKKNLSLNKLLEGFKYINNDKQLLYLLLFTLILNISLVIFELFIPYYAKVVLENGEIFGIAMSIQSIGGILASFLVGIFAKKSKMTYQSSIFGILLGFIPLLLINQWTFLLAVFLINFFTVMFNVLFFSFIQETTDGNYIGRVVSAIYFIAGLGMPIGSFTFATLFDLPFILALNILTIFTIAIFITYLQINRKITREAQDTIN